MQQCLPEIYQSLVGERGWSSGAYQDWLGTALIDQLLSEP